MTTTTSLHLPGKNLQITTTTEVGESEFGTPRPKMTIRVIGEAHWKVTRALALQAAAQLELALVERGVNSLVDISAGVAPAFDRHGPIGSQTTIAIELVGDEKRMPLLAELAIAKDAMEAIARRLNAARVTNARRAA